MVLREKILGKDFQQYVSQFKHKLC